MMKTYRDKEARQRDIGFLKEALKEARKAERRKEVPVGAIVTYRDTIVGRGHNQSITRNDPAAHAEILALRQAARRLKNYRLAGCTVYATVEPCPMCAGALVWARVSRLVFGAYDKKAGGCASVFRIPQSRKLNHRVKVTGGILERECRGIMQRFFEKLRRKRQ